MLAFARGGPKRNSDEETRDLSDWSDSGPVRFRGLGVRFAIEETIIVGIQQALQTRTTMLCDS